MIGTTEDSFRKLIFYTLLIFIMLCLFDRIIGIEYYENSNNNGNNIRKRRMIQLKRRNNINIDNEQVLDTLLNQP